MQVASSDGTHWNELDRRFAKQNEGIIGGLAPAGTVARAGLCPSRRRPAYFYSRLTYLAGLIDALRQIPARDAVITLLQYDHFLRVR